MQASHYHATMLTHPEQEQLESNTLTQNCALTTGLLLYIGLTGYLIYDYTHKKITCHNKPDCEPSSAEIFAAMLLIAFLASVILAFSTNKCCRRRGYTQLNNQEDRPTDDIPMVPITRNFSPA